MAMKSPFPGMDPFLERYWGDIHTSFIVYARDQLNEQLPGDLQARVEEQVCVDLRKDEGRRVYPDVQIVEEPDPRGGPAVAAGGVAVAEPLVIPVSDEPPTQRHLEIIDSSDGERVVTAIELLSRANKIGDAGRRLYRRKQQDYLAGGVNLVEIDLLREGRFVLAMRESLIPEASRTPYRVGIRRVSSPEHAEFFAMPLREPLPSIRVPLRPQDRDVVLQLQPLLEACYRHGRYGNINYRQRLHPPLNPDDEQWLDVLLREKGLR